jgi:hypothetical protein
MLLLKRSTLPNGGYSPKYFREMLLVMTTELGASSDCLASPNANG